MRDVNTECVAKNCELFLDKVLKNIEKIGSLFEDYEILTKDVLFS